MICTSAKDENYMANEIRKTNVAKLILANIEYISTMIDNDEVVTIAPSRSGAKLLHAPKASRDGFVRVEFEHLGVSNERS